MSSENSIVPAGLKNFTASLIDYAGLFPPASLELPQAFHNYIFYSQGLYKWMLGKFIIPAKKLQQLSLLLNDLHVSETIHLSVLGSGGASITEFRENFSNDTALIKDFLSVRGNIIQVDAFEVRLPADLFEKNNLKAASDLFNEISHELEVCCGKSIPVFYEVNLSENYEDDIVKAVEAIASANRNSLKITSNGFKLRTGGTEAAAFPEPAVIAFAIMSCCEFNVPMKCTAGLHHPVRHFNSSVNTVMHGFLNVFGAGILAYTNGLDEAELLEILGDEDPYEFNFSDEGFKWNEVAVSSEEISEARKNLMISYGSCSFDEPVDDLKTLELLK